MNPLFCMVEAFVLYMFAQFRLADWLCALHHRRFASTTVDWLPRLLTLSSQLMQSPDCLQGFGDGLTMKETKRFVPMFITPHNL